MINDEKVRDRCEWGRKCHGFERTGNACPRDNYDGLSSKLSQVTASRSCMAPQTASLVFNLIALGLEMKKRPDCTHQWDDESRCQPAFINHYECDYCRTAWQDAWSCGCDDECPSCHLDISQSYSEEIATRACAY